MDTTSRRQDVLASDQPFVFSQAALQDYQDCRRRFQLRYLLKAAWPAPQAEPVREHERHVRRGERFHRLAQQALLGVPLDRLAAVASADSDEHLSQWWHNFTLLLPELQGEKRFVETLLSAPLASHRLLAKYDLILLNPDQKLLIFDWKTGLKRPRRAWLENRSQTRVYPYLAVRAASGLYPGLSRLPEQVEMVYWGAAHPAQPEKISYTPEQYQQDERDLLGLVREIESLSATQFDPTSDERACRFCVYRSYCDRGKSAGIFTETEDDFEPEEEIEIHFDQIAEISF